MHYPVEYVYLPSETQWIERRCKECGQFTTKRDLQINPTHLHHAHCSAAKLVIRYVTAFPSPTLGSISVVEVKRPDPISNEFLFAVQSAAVLHGAVQHKYAFLSLPAEHFSSGSTTYTVSNTFAQAVRVLYFKLMDSISFFTAQQEEMALKKKELEAARKQVQALYPADNFQRPLVDLP